MRERRWPRAGERNNAVFYPVVDRYGRIITILLLAIARIPLGQEILVS